MPKYILRATKQVDGQFYGLVKFSQAELSGTSANGLAPKTLSLSSVTIHMVRWALAQNLSSLPSNPKQAHLGRFQ